MEAHHVADGVVPVGGMHEAAVWIGGKIFGAPGGVRIRGTNENFWTANAVGDAGKLHIRVSGQKMLAQSSFAGIDKPGILVLVVAGPELVATSDLGEVGLAHERVRASARMGREQRVCDYGA